jgi:hypothetical protein
VTTFWTGVVLAFIACSISAVWLGIAIGRTTNQRDRQVPSQNEAKS